MRVPFVARWPGMLPAGTLDEPAIVMDLFTTLADLGGGQVPADRVIDGRDSGPAVDRHREPRPGDFVFFKTFHSGDPSYGVRRPIAMRSGRWKLFFDDSPQPTELYDLETDVSETTPIDDPLVKATLFDAARDYDCRIDDAPPPDGAWFDRARYRPVAASSSTDCNTSSRAADGLDTTWWESDDGAWQWIQVDLGQTQPVGWVSLRWGLQYARVYVIQVSNDGVVWQPVAAETHGDGGQDLIGVSAAARYVRVQTLQSSGTAYDLRTFSVVSHPARSAGGLGSAAASH